MGYIKEPDGVTFVVNKKKLTNEIENRIRKFINASKIENKKFIENIKNSKSISLSKQ